ncbi:MAG: RsmE family RNA methyltransferase, partial [Thermodesulfobacteriota bacterium]
MPRFYVPNPSIQDGLLKIEGEEVKHIRKVLRLKAGDKIILFNGLGKEYEGAILEETASSVLVKVQNISSPQKDSPLKVTLAQSLLKGEKMDFLIQKATELGVKEIIPFLSSRSVPFLEKSRRPER